MVSSDAAWLYVLTIVYLHEARSPDGRFTQEVVDRVGVHVPQGKLCGSCDYCRVVRAIMRASAPGEESKRAMRVARSRASTSCGLAASAVAAVRALVA